jgi:Leucine-rich repeat (LRR) protein
MEIALKRIRTLNGSTDLNLAALNLRTLPPIPEGVTILHCAFNNLQEIPVLPESLTHLYCSFNDITRIDKLPRGLQYLSCAFNAIEILPTFFPHIKEIDCRYNNIHVMLIPEMPADAVIQYDNNSQTVERDCRESSRDFIERITELYRKCRIKSRLRKIKEELIMKCWHPARVLRLMNEYSIEPEEL